MSESSIPNISGSSGGFLNIYIYIPKVLRYSWIFCIKPDGTSISFNPPTRGHMSIIVSALQTSTTGRDAPNSQCTRYSRILLLLAVQNADKGACAPYISYHAPLPGLMHVCLLAPQPASFGDRLAMMLQFAEDIHSVARGTGLSILPVEVGVIKHARFLDKAIALRKAYPEGGEMVFLTGFDTLIRLFDPKYYGGTLAPLAPFFEKGNSIQCCFRPMEGGGGEWKREQEMYLEEIREGKREGEGCSREWGARVQMMVSLVTNADGRLLSANFWAGFRTMDWYYRLARRW